MVLTSGTGQESFDSIALAPEVKLDYDKTPGGFHALVTIPLTFLGRGFQPGDSVRMDLGYLFGNATGSQIAARSYWSNTGFAAGVTNDIPNESRLVPGEWGTATVE